MSYTDDVGVISRMNNRSALRYAVGALLCWLLVVYAVGAKLALYHTTQPGAKSVAATKAWQDHDATVNPVDVQLASAMVATPSLSIAALLLAAALAVVWVLPDDPRVPAVFREFLPTLAVRPPPAA